MRLRSKILVALVVIFAVVIAACDHQEDTSADKQRIHSVHQRASAFARAEAAAPLPHTENFPLRKTLVEMTKRQDLVNHPWYVYIIADTGNTIGYYVAKTVPVNACDFLGSTEQIYHDSDGGNIKLTSPSLDGIFYGGSGSASGCDAWVFLDQATNALIQIRGVNFYTADKPLALNTQPITVKQ